MSGYRRIKPGSICVVCRKAVGRDRWGRINGRQFVASGHGTIAVCFSCLEKLPVQP
jgi:hypothetical protein